MKKVALLIVGLFLVAIVSGCIGGGTTTTGGPTTTEKATSAQAQEQTQTQQAKKIKVAVLFDVGGRGDLSFNDMAYLGAERAKKELGVEIEYMTPKSTSDMTYLLAQLAQSKEYDLIVLIGFLWTDPLNKVADKYPEQKFALIDSTTGKVRPNEVDILFREQEVAALMGVIASGMAYELGGDTIGAVAGMDIPPLWKFHIGYLFGAKYFEKKTGKPVKLLWQYTGTFTDTQVGYNTAMQLLQQGAKVLYGLAGLTHVGMFNAVIDWNEEGKGKALAMGQDASQEWYAPKYIPISGAKRVDVAVYDAIKMVVDGTWKGGIVTLGLKENGVGYWDLDGVKQFAELAYQAGKLKGMTPDEVVKIVKEQRERYIKPYVWDIVNELAEKIKSGEIVFKTPKTHEEYEKIIEELQKGNLSAALEKGSVG
ncbi:BMP family ABC transporter substrate-binding protein [Thermococcus chitonophagus]|uniref:BMP family ABC transporter substrate-binding protein n=1 Tax=Thermococcus chitonophagus TaxID=54262 RepID=A0A170SVD5_9EURY|nr:BMP family protein [Thermococcus chitonophagus]ASJ16270.1 BMP family ABC transporter substrate-binding protein [Thermococcus chitonophagus]CUX78745.1 Nucleoside ABC transporter, periplasmic nucleoside-binding protein [Thermococcus chitonophagus]